MKPRPAFQHPSSRGTTVRILAVMLLSLAATALMLHRITRMAQQTIYGQDDEIAEMYIDAIAHSIRDRLTLTREVSNSFSLTFARFREHKMWITKPEDLKEYSEADIYTLLENFINTYPEYHSAALIFEPGCLLDAPGGTAALVRSQNRRHLNLKEHTKDIFHHPLYLKALTHRSPYFTRAGHVKDDDTAVITHVTPLFFPDSTLAGEFWIDIALNKLSEVFRREAPANELKVMLLDTDLTVLASNNSLYNHRNVINCLKSTDRMWDEEAERQIRQAVSKRSSASYTIPLSNDYYDLSFRPVEPFRFMLMTVMSHGEIYDKLNRYGASILLTILIGFLLIIPCMMYAFASYKKTANEKLRTEADLCAAAGIQQKMLPDGSFSDESVVVHAFTHPARQVGGDLYDFLVRDGRLTFCIGDVSGKGMPASLLMASATAHFRSQAGTGKTVSRMLAAIDEALADRNDTMMFCTMVLGVLDLQSGALELGCAGHEKPILMSLQGCRLLEMPANRPLGLFPGAPFATVRLTLQPGECLYCYTDGITEARATDRSLLRVETLMTVLSGLCRSEAAALPAPEDINGQVLSAVREFSKGARQSDDITMLCLKRK